MKFVPDSVLNYALMVKWKGKGNVLFVADFQGSKKKLLLRFGKLFETMLKDNDAIVVFRKSIAFYKNNKCGLCTMWGKELLPCEYDEIFVADDLNLAEVKKDGYTGVYSVSKKVFVIPTEYQHADLYLNVVKVKKSDLFGVLNLNGRTIIPCEYSEIWMGGKENCYYIAEKNGEYYVFAKNGKRLANSTFDNYIDAGMKALELLKK